MDDGGDSSTVVMHGDSKLSNALNTGTVMDALTGKLRRYVRPRVGSRDDAEDVIQEAYLRVLRYSVDHGVEDMERLLFSAAKNLAVDSIRRRRTRDKTATSYAALEADTQSWPALDEQVYLQQRLSSVEAAVAVLPERCREVFLMHRVESLSYSQIAARCGISVSAVEKNIARACLLLGAAIRPEEVAEQRDVRS
jgi:RNA polymerase sigma factor (sigma-70 family)